MPCENSLIHVFTDTSTENSFKFTELPQDETEILFPEFNFDENYLTQPDQPLPLILWMDVFYVPSEERKRLSAVAWENGNVQVCTGVNIKGTYQPLWPSLVPSTELALPL